MKFFRFAGVNVWVLGFLVLGRPPACARQSRDSVQFEPIMLFDSLRQRPVPVVTYFSATLPKYPKLALLSHGYGGKNTDYSFLARELVRHGYLVASVQHEVPGDEPLPTVGKPADVRRPNWERGVLNLRFAIAELKRRYPRVDTRHLLVLGHSNGGDLVMLFTQRYPREVEYVVSLDNRRMPLPRTRRPRVLSLRSSDQPADAGVLPTPEEQQRYRMTIVKLPNTTHNDLWDGATEAQKKEILGYLSGFLKK